MRGVSGAGRRGARHGKCVEYCKVRRTLLPVPCCCGVCETRQGVVRVGLWGGHPNNVGGARERRAGAYSNSTR